MSSITNTRSIDTSVRARLTAGGGAGGAVPPPPPGHAAGGAGLSSSDGTGPPVTTRACGRNVVARSPSPQMLAMPFLFRAAVKAESSSPQRSQVMTPSTGPSGTLDCSARAAGEPAAPSITTVGGIRHPIPCALSSGRPPPASTAAAQRMQRNTRALLAALGLSDRAIRCPHVQRGQLAPSDEVGADVDAGALHDVHDTGGQAGLGGHQREGDRSQRPAQ